MNLRQDETWHRLRDWTYGQTPSERLSALILQFAGYTDVDPIHPLGGPDGGKDALARKDGQSWIMAVYFAHGPKSYADVKSKFEHDIKGALKNKAQGIAFVTNQALTDNNRKLLSNLAGDSVQVDIFHLERLVTILDNPAMHAVRQQYLLIPMPGRRADDPEYKRAKYLENLITQSYARRKRRVRAAGIDECREDSIFEFIQSTYRAKILQIITYGKLNVVTADAGSGKTEWTTQ